MAYSSITYADKVENNGATPAGRFGADDLNEIKTVTNANGADFDGRIDLLEAGGGGINNLTSSGHVGDGTTVTFPLSFTPQTEVPQAFVVGIDGVLQSPIDAYTVSTTTDAITFSSAPPVNSEIVVSTANVLTGTDISASTIIATGSTTTRLLTDRFADTVNVKDFGAVGDGVADDTVAIQLAIDTVEAGQKVFFPDGVYRCTNTITVGKAIKLEMESADVASRLLFDTAITRTVQTTYTHPDDGADPAINVALKIDAIGVEIENMVVDLYVNYQDTSATNFGTDIDIGIFIKSKAKTIINKCRTRGYWRIAGLYGDCTVDGGTLDRTSIYDCRFQGFWSVYIQGAKTKTSESEILLGDDRGDGGVSDWHASRVWLEGWSHHSKVRKSDSDGGCLKVDGKLYAGTSSINAIQGRVWLNCRLDGADPYLLKIENAIRDKFVACFVDRKTGYFKTDGITGVGTADCLLSLAAGSQNVFFDKTDIYNTTLDIDVAATYRIKEAYNDDLELVGERSFLPALTFGTGITYTSRSGAYNIDDQSNVL